MKALEGTLRGEKGGRPIQKGLYNDGDRSAAVAHRWGERGWKYVIGDRQAQAIALSSATGGGEGGDAFRKRNNPY